MTAESKTSAPSPLFTIDVDQLEKAPCEMDREIPLEWLATEMTACEYPARPVSARLIMEAALHDAGVLVKGVITLEAEAECGLCLASVPLSLKCPVSCFLMNKGEREDLGEDDELTPEDLEREWYEGETIALDDIIRDAVMLELPMVPKCADGCAEALAKTPTQPEERQIDPRLAPLASIKLSKE